MRLCIHMYIYVYTYREEIKTDITFIGHKNQKHQLTMNCVYGQQQKQNNNNNHNHKEKMAVSKKITK